MARWRRCDDGDYGLYRLRLAEAILDAGGALPAPLFKVDSQQLSTAAYSYVGAHEEGRRHAIAAVICLASLLRFSTERRWRAAA